MLHLGSIRGTTIDVDFNFMILIAFFVAMNYNAELGIQYALLWIPILFLSVLVHELAHAAAIGMFGFGASQIVLTGMGGVTINRRKARPWQDMVISLAGPISSFGLMFLGYFAQYTEFAQQDQMLKALLPRMVAANLWWGLFNLVPLAPLDGGHAVRDFFRMFLDERRAFICAIWVGIPIGTVIAVWQLTTGAIFVSLFIAWFVYVAWQQWQYFRQHGIPGD